MELILRCGQCKKPFDKESTLKRHGYYCRSRKAGKTDRARSCVCCARRKARCDNKRPECSRCKGKGLDCSYPTSTYKDSSPRSQHSNDAPTERSDSTTSLVVNSPASENRLETSKKSHALLNDALATSDSALESFEDNYLNWNDPSISFADLMNPKTNEGTSGYPSLDWSAAISRATPSTNQTLQVQPAFSYFDVSMPSVPISNIRKLIQRPQIRTGTQRTANLILYTLKSYPRMLLQPNHFPPFIHPYLVSSNEDNNDMELLTNCISLVHMISNGVQGNRKLFWKNVRMECERMHAEYMELNKWELLAAMQALSIYIIIRLEEGETEHNNFEFLLIATVTAIAQQLNCKAQAALHNVDFEIGWKEWIFEESARRLCVVYQVVNMLVYFEPAAMCNLEKDLILAPLPAKKQLWEAADEFMWKMESARGLEVQTAFGMAANGDLVKLDEGQLFLNADWEEWYSGMDSFGGLIMLAASLIA